MPSKYFSLESKYLLSRPKWHNLCIIVDRLIINDNAMKHALSFHLSRRLSTQSGFTLVELMIAIALVGILSSIAIPTYQIHVKKTQLTTIYQNLNQFKIPYQILLDEGAEITSYNPNGLNMRVRTKYCQFSVIAPNINTATPNAVVCQIQNLNYLTDQTLSLDLGADGTWQCRASSGIPVAYLPVACR